MPHFHIDVRVMPRPALLDPQGQAVEHALHELDRKALDAGYDGVIGLKIGHPNVVDGGVEVIVYGNGFRRVAPEGQ